MTLTIPTLFPADAVAPVAEQLRASVVAVQDGNRGGGAGVIWSDDGLIVTNAHVATGDTVLVTLPDGRRLGAPILARQPEQDLALLRIEVPKAELVPAEPADISNLRVGQLVFAIGHPLGVANAVVIGIINRLPAREVTPRFISANIRLNRGNSGGPLADARGHVLGINTMVATPGIGLAIPSDAVAEFVRRNA